MDPVTNAIVATLTSGAAAVARGTASDYARDAYQRLMELLAGRLPSAKLIDEDPTNDAYKAEAEAEAADKKLADDPQVMEAARALNETLAKLLPEEQAASGIDIERLNAATNVIVEGLLTQGPIAVRDVTALGGRIEMRDIRGTVQACPVPLGFRMEHVSAGRDVVVQLSDMAPQDLGFLATLSASPLAGDRRELLRRLDALIPEKNRALTEAVAGFLKVLGETETLPERLGEKLLEIAERLQHLEKQVKAKAADDPETARLKVAARIALQRRELGRAGALLAEVTELHSATSDREAVEAAATRAQLGEIALARSRYREAADHFAHAAARIPSGLGQERLGYLERQASALYSQGDEPADDGALAEAIILYRRLSEYQPRDRDRRKWVELRMRLAAGHQLLGWRTSDTGRLQEAVKLFREIGDAVSYESEPDDWIMARVGQGRAQQALGWLEQGTARLEQAVSVLRETQNAIASDHEPAHLGSARPALEWETLHNLGNALEALGWRLHLAGRRTDGMNRLRDADQVFRQASSTAGILKLQQAMTEADLGRALTSLGKLEVGSSSFERAVNVLRAAMRLIDETKAPRLWAELRYRLGQAFEYWGWRLVSCARAEEGMANLQEARRIYEANLKERPRDKLPLAWAATQSSMGHVLFLIGTHTDNATFIEDGERTLRAALEERTEDRIRPDWLETQRYLANTCRELGVRNSNRLQLEEALNIFKLIQKELDEGRMVPDAHEIGAVIAELESTLGQRKFV